MKISFGSLICALFLILPEVTSWTIDLPEARKFLFEKNDRLEKGQKWDISKQVFYINREHSNSKHHEHGDHDPYAREYGYQAYMEKKVRDVVYEGSEYLEGLQRSVEEFSRLLASCAGDQMYENSFNTSSNTAPDSSRQEPWRPSIELTPTNRTDPTNRIDLTNRTDVTNQTDGSSERCERASKSREHVRRLAELATKTTKELQDIAYSRKYLKADPHDLSREENELILKLAWFLDRLALHTGYRPRAKPYPRDEHSTSTTLAPTPMTLVPAPEPVKRLMMSCLHEKSSVPADERCRYPLPLPTLPLFNNTNTSSSDSVSSSNTNEQVLPVNAGSGSKDQEILIATDHRPIYLAYPYFRRTVRSVRKRSAPETELSNLSKGTEDPAITFMKYFIKHKIWESDNPSKLNKGFENYDVNNHLRSKRAASDNMLKIPEDPFQDLSKYIKHKKGVHLLKDDILAQEINNAILKILNTKAQTPKEHIRKISKLFRTKRSYRYDNIVYKPRDPEDLFKDISYYVKNKYGTNFKNDFAQAAQLRAGLEQIFLNPNIETVRRYGANFNPLVPDPLILGALRSGADNI